MTDLSDPLNRGNITWEKPEPEKWLEYSKKPSEILLF